jgi:predicted aspartyl protease
MITRFDRRAGLIVVRTRLWGPTGERTARLALDTGATFTVLDAAFLVALGYDPVVSTRRIQLTTGSGVEFVPLVAIDRLEALGESRSGFVVVAHTLPPSASVDGLLGLDFLRERDLGISFKRGEITLE